MKFNRGDKVRINHKAPEWIREFIKYSRTRTVEGSFYNKAQQHRLYQLYGDIPFSFRASMLKPVTSEQLVKTGRPKRRRTYIKHETTTPYLKSTDSRVVGVSNTRIPLVRIFPIQSEVGVL